MMEKCLEHTHFQAKAPYDKERFDLGSVDIYFNQR